MLFFLFFRFDFSKFQMATLKNLIEKAYFFKMVFEGSYEVLIRHKYFWSTYFLQWNEDPFKFFSNFHGNAFSFFNFSEWKKYYKLTSQI